MEQWEIFLLCYLGLINVIAFLLMGIDKRRAKQNRWRIKERTLFLTAVLGGSIGAMLGMQLFRHKTKHQSFCVGMPAIFLVQVVIGIIIIWR